MEPVNFIASCARFVFFGISPDPAAVVAEMRPHCPLPIELVAGWIVPPQERGALQSAVTAKLRNARVKGSDWFRVDPERAASILAVQAKAVDGRVWQVRKRPVTEKPPPFNAREIITPHGRFPSAAEAARALGITKAAVSERAVKRSPGWRYADDDRPQPPPAPRGRPVGWRKYPDGKPAEKSPDAD